MQSPSGDVVPHRCSRDAGSSRGTTAPRRHCGEQKGLSWGGGGRGRHDVGARAVVLLFQRAERMRLLLIVVCAVLFTSARAEEGARLLASKSLLNKYAVEGRDLTLQYSIYNVGSSAALDVELGDDSFPPEDFGIVNGMLTVKWDRIAPASNVTHTVVLRPLKAGYFNFTSATVSYLAQEGGPMVVGYTSAPGQGGILAQREFDRRFSPHFLDWAAFGVMTLPSIGIPLLLWYSSKRKYDTAKYKKN